MNVSERAMPIVRAIYDELRRAWILQLPGGVSLEARDTAAAELLRDKHAPGSAISWSRETEAELRAAWGDR